MTRTYPDIASAAEVDTGTNVFKVVTPKELKDHIDSILTESANSIDLTIADAAINIAGASLHYTCPTGHVFVGYIGGKAHTSQTVTIAWVLSGQGSTQFFRTIDVTNTTFHEGFAVCMAAGDELRANKTGTGSGNELKIKGQEIRKLWT